MLAQFVRSFDTEGNGQLRPAWIATSITSVTASNITQTTATITVSRSNPVAGTLYFVIVPQGVTPAWSRGNVATNSGWTATTIAYHDADTDPGTGSTYQFVPDASGLSAGTAYDLWAVWDDGATTVGPVQGTGFTTASAGATYNDSLSESATLADATAASNLLTALLAETVALADGVTAGATFAQTLIESVTTADSLASAATFSTALAETTTPSDATAAATTFAVSLAEAVTLLDASSNGSLYTEVLTASVALSDALANTVTLTGAVTESMALSDALANTVTLTGAVTESMALSDALNALATFQATLSEAVAAGDLVATQAELPRVALGARVQATSLSARLQ